MSLVPGQVVWLGHPVDGALQALADVDTGRAYMHAARAVDAIARAAGASFAAGFAALGVVADGDHGVDDVAGALHLARVVLGGAVGDDVVGQHDLFAQAGADAGVEGAHLDHGAFVLAHAHAQHASRRDIRRRRHARAHRGASACRIARAVRRPAGLDARGARHAGAGDVVGPASSTDSVLAVYDGTTGKLLKNSTMAISNVGYIGSPQVSGGASAYTLALTDAGGHVYFTGGSTATLTVPTNASVAFPTGTTILVLNNNSGNLTISGAGVTFQLANGTTGNRTVATKGMASLLKVATDTWWVTGPGVT